MCLGTVGTIGERFELIRSASATSSRLKRDHVVPDEKYDDEEGRQPERHLLGQGSRLSHAIFDSPPLSVD
jgi:hypothetical protein